MNHRVSVIIPVMNMARFLPDAVASIPDVHEVVIAVAESDDDTLRVARELARGRAGVVVLDNPKGTPASGRNVGLRHASGNIIAFNDADDVWPRGKLDLQLARLDREPRADVVGGRVTYFDKFDRETLTPAPHARLETGFTFALPPMIFRRSVFDRVGFFDESLTYVEDVDLILRIIETDVPFVILDAATLYYRRHGNSMMNRDKQGQNRDFARVLSLSLERRRKLGLSLAPLSFEHYLETPVQVPKAAASVVASDSPRRKR
jgi:glycosyltransferase involved in cell wall biosynthesis